MKFFKTKKQKIWTGIIIVYNILGLVGILGLSPNDPFYWNWIYSMILVFITLPVSLAGYLYHFVDSSLYPVFIIQGIVLIISILFINYITKENR